ncbi:MATE family efflux transporter [Clostridium sp. AM58-1XD]|uniref:MATE family efflux transporter n=1 Tax=Clostridium sp. AM58-1XD TaxID=2292307 RepID=UPI000E4D4F3E|nr:MATE family efflux transporter [Clostridium sp. AM58-1XD]RGY98240.1 MATE family efflux transporter [Clostridium sp. AM58-1XD]
MKQNSNQYLVEAPIGKLMMKFSIPCIMSLLVSSLYNIVDQIFIGRGVGYLGNGATNVVFPITVIALALALMLGDGCAAFLSICQGKKDTEGTRTGAGNNIVMLVLSSIVIMVIFMVCREGILNAFGATENNIEYAREYFDIIVIGIPFFMFTNGLNSVIRADGSPQFAMISTLIGCIINIILDPVAIFVLHWGVKGAAIATIAGQTISAALAFYYLFRTKSFKLDRKCFAIKTALLKRILPLGISSFLTQLSIVIIMGVMNNVLVKYGAMSKYGSDIPMTVVGIVMKVFQIVIAVVVGVAAGSQPIVGYNYGAGRMDRVKEIYKKMMMIEVGIGIIATICFEIFPMNIISLFGSESDLYNEYGVMAFRIFLSTITLCCVQKATSIFLQSLGKPVMSMGLSLLREFVLSVPLVLILPLAFGITGPLFSGPAADVISFLAVLLMMKSVMKELNAAAATKRENTEEKMQKRRGIREKRKCIREV